MKFSPSCLWNACWNGSPYIHFAIFTNAVLEPNYFLSDRGIIFFKHPVGFPLHAKYSAPRIWNSNFFICNLDVLRFCSKSSSDVTYSAVTLIRVFNANYALLSFYAVCLELHFINSILILFAWRINHVAEATRQQTGGGGKICFSIGNLRLPMHRSC
jgi:hypothetical protein